MMPPAVVFTSVDYAILLVVTVGAFWSVPTRFTQLVLIIASVVFYAHWSVPYLALFALAILIGYGIARAIETRRSAGAGGASALVLLAGVSLLGLLAYFKYADFLLETLAVLGARPHAPLDILLPLAISFYTFQILGYVIDVYRGAPAERSVTRFALFVAFFPQLIAGPICRAHELLPQLAARPAFQASRLLWGLQLLAYGVVKKTVVADNLAVFVDRVYGAPTAAGGLDVLVATLAFGGQIYCDFSGYTDIARGSARLFNIELPVNFRSPYVAVSLTDFWRRWHITLSSWLRDYLYIPLGGNRACRRRTYANILVTMALGGLWHGASATFVLWGVFHGVFLVLERGLGLAGHTGSVPRRIARTALTFVLVQIGWAIFRAEDYATLSVLVARVVTDPLGTSPVLGTGQFVPLVVAAYVLHGISALVRSRATLWPTLGHPALAAPSLAAATLLAVVFGGSSDAFIYFQF
jgi:D-alanyl-lipoteichoic acid acyltransferase DltB (MBOAT superfamily)